MKKIISLGLASAVCALTAVAASADAIKFNDVKEATEGTTIVVPVKAAEAISMPMFKIAVDGFEIVSTDVVEDDMTVFNKENNTYVSANSVAADTTLFNITLKVTALTGKTATMTLTEVGTGESKVLGSYTVDVKAAATSTPSESTPSESKPAESTPSESKPADENKNPETGIALAVVPAVLAAAGVVVAKKRK